MTKILTFFLFYISIGIVNMILFSFYLSTSNLPGGDVGMMPILIMVLSLITSGISLVVGLFFHLIKKSLNYLKAIILYHIVYFGISGYEIFRNIFKDWNNPYVQLNLWLILISIIVLFISILIANLLDKNIRKKQGST